MGRENAVYEKFRKDYPVLKEQPVWEAFELLLKAAEMEGKSWSAATEAAPLIQSTL